MRVRDFKEYELQLIVEFFMHYLQPEMRGELMRQFPYIYNRLVDREVMVSVNQTRINEEGNGSC